MPLGPDLVVKKDWVEYNQVTTFVQKNKC